MKIGEMVLLKQGLKLVRAVVVDIDLTYVTLRLDYKQGFGADIKLDINSEDIIKPSGLHVDGFDYKDDIGFFRAWCSMKNRYKVSIYENDEVISISVQDVVSKLKQIQSYQKSSLITININLNLFIANEIEKLKNKLKRSSQIND